LLKRLTSFMALRDPDLLAAATAVVGADALLLPFQAETAAGVHDGDRRHVPHPTRQHHRLPPQPSPEPDTETLLQRQEAELAWLHHEAEATKLRIPEVRRQAKAAVTAASESAARAQAQAQQAAEAAKREEARKARLREEAARVSELVAEAAKLAVAKALAEAREHDYMMAFKLLLR